MKFNKMDTENLKNEGLGSVTGLERRTFLKLGFVITGVYASGKVLSLVTAKEGAYAQVSAPATGEYPYKPHYSMLIREGLCIDCERCIAACAETNSVPSYGYRTRIMERVVPDAIGKKREFVPVLCNHCNVPPCTRVCPTKATYKDQTNGIVMMNRKKCIGCKFCVVACPYNARYFNYEYRAIDKCNFCFDTRLSKGETLTACANACPTGARTFGDLTNTEDFVYKMVHQLEKAVWVNRPETGAVPNVFYMKY